MLWNIKIFRGLIVRRDAICLALLVDLPSLFGNFDSFVSYKHDWGLVKLCKTSLTRCLGISGRALLDDSQMVLRETFAHNKFVLILLVLVIRN